MEWVGELWQRALNEIRVATGVKTVVFTEDTATPYANGGGVIIFN